MAESATPPYRLTTWLSGAAIVVLMYLLAMAPLSCLIMRDPRYHEYARTLEIISFPYGGFKYFDTPVRTLLMKYEEWWFERLVLRHRARGYAP